MRLLKKEKDVFIEKIRRQFSNQITGDAAIFCFVNAETKLKNFI